MKFRIDLDSKCASLHDTTHKRSRNKIEGERKRNQKTLLPLLYFFTFFSCLSLFCNERARASLKRRRFIGNMAQKPHLQLGELGSKLDTLPSSNDALIELLKVCPLFFFEFIVALFPIRFEIYVH